MPVDPVLARDCDYPVRSSPAGIDLADAYMLRGEALRECTCRMRAIREAPAGAECQ